MAIGTFPGMLQEGDHAGRPAATAVGSGALYACSDHALIYQSDGATWSTWATLGGGAPAAHAASHESGGSDEIDVTGLVGAGGGGGVTALLDIAPGSPHASDDEFSASGLAGWTNFGTCATRNANTDAEGHLHLVQNAQAGLNVGGIYKASPSTPFDMKARVSDFVARGDYNGAGIVIAEAGMTGALVVLKVVHSGTPGAVAADKYSSITAYASTPIGPIQRYLDGPVWLRLLVTTTSNVSMYISTGGYIWQAILTGYNPGFTIGAVGLAVISNNPTYPGDAYFDWVRFS